MTTPSIKEEALKSCESQMSEWGNNFEKELAKEAFLRGARWALKKAEEACWTGSSSEKAVRQLASELGGGE